MSKLSAIALLSFAKSMGWLNALVSQGHLL
jgi:hypothetical protein